uniref:Uncharacterized protein n=1 Tax=Opuntia streptacantha TaxID=393608 RepID=A0A7C9CZL7_OPUST
MKIKFSYSFEKHKNKMASGVLPQVIIEQQNRFMKAAFSNIAHTPANECLGQKLIIKLRVGKKNQLTRGGTLIPIEALMHVLVMKVYEEKRDNKAIQRNNWE